MSLRLYDYFRIVHDHSYDKTKVKIYLHLVCLTHSTSATVVKCEWYSSRQLLCLSAKLVSLSHITFLHVSIRFNRVSNPICVAYSNCIVAPRHYLNQCWYIVNWTLRANFGGILYIFIYIHSRKCIWKCPLQTGHFFSASKIPRWR